jgi:hypothetical protein
VPLRCVVPAFLVSACSLVGAERPPASVEPKTRFICTDTYWLPGADAAATVGAIALAGWSIHRAREGCATGDPDTCDGQAGLAVLLPIPFAISGVVGARRVHRCRAVRGWQSRTTAPQFAGQNGAACVPVYGAEGRCDAGYCVRGRCQAEMPAARLRPFCAGPINRWRLATESQRARRLAEIPAACRALAR